MLRISRLKSTAGFRQVPLLESEFPLLEISRLKSTAGFRQVALLESEVLPESFCVLEVLAVLGSGMIRSGVAAVACALAPFRSADAAGGWACAARGAPADGVVDAQSTIAPGTVTATPVSGYFMTRRRLREFFFAVSAIERMFGRRLVSSEHSLMHTKVEGRQVEAYTMMRSHLHRLNSTVGGSADRHRHGSTTRERLCSCP